MARLEALLLCDFAQVRQNLLFVSSAGITRINIAQFPAQIPLSLGLMIYVPPDEIGQIHELVVTVKYPEDATKIAEIRGVIQASADNAYSGEGLHLPAAIPLLNVRFPHPGQVDVQVAVDADGPQDWSLWLQHPPS